MEKIQNMRSFSSSSEDSEESLGYLEEEKKEPSPAPSEGLTIPVPNIHHCIVGSPTRSFRRGSGNSSKLGLGSGSGPGHYRPKRKDSHKFDENEIETPTNEKIRRFFKKLFRQKNLERTFPILKWAPQYNFHKLLHDTIAGFTVAMTVIPQALAYATVAGLPPQYGLYASWCGPFVYIIFGTIPSINIGVSAIQSILTYKYTVDKPPEYAVFLCFTTAVFTLVLGIFRLGFIANFISAPVISAFTSGVALTIISTQLKPLLGLSFASEEFVDTIQGLSHHIDEINKHDALLGMTCCILLLTVMYLQKLFHCITRKFPRFEKVLWFLSVSKSALIMLGSTILVAYWYPDQPFSIVGHISPGLPAFKPPPFEIYSPMDNRTHSFSDILKEEASALFVVPLLSIIGHCTVVKVFAGTDTERVDAAQEILVLGISNLIASFFSSMPIGGSFSRTTVNVQSGVKTPTGGLITGVLVILALQYLTPYFFFLPKASIAAVICVSCLFMVNPYIILPLWRSKKMDLIPWAVTFLVTLFLGLEYGIAIGILISALFLLFYSARPRVKVCTRQTPKGTVFIYVLLDRSLTFPSVDYISNQIIKAATQCGSTDRPVVIDCHHIQYADFTAAEGMRDLIANMSNIGYQVFFWKVKPSVFRVISGTMRNTDFPLFRCNNEDELDAVLDGVHRRLSMFHPFVIRDGFKRPLRYSPRKMSDTSVAGTAASAFSTGVFV